MAVCVEVQNAIAPRRGRGQGGRDRGSTSGRGCARRLPCSVGYRYVGDGHKVTSSERRLVRRSPHHGRPTPSGRVTVAAVILTVEPAVIAVVFSTKSDAVVPTVPWA